MKVLDFGLARAVEPPSTMSPGDSQSPTNRNTSDDARGDRSRHSRVPGPGTGTRQTAGQARTYISRIFERAAAGDFVIAIADTDFGTLLARRSISKPSLIRCRDEGSRKPEALAALMLSNLTQLTETLTTGGIVTFEPAACGFGRFRSRVEIRAVSHVTRPI